MKTDKRAERYFLITVTIQHTVFHTNVPLAEKLNIFCTLEWN